MEIQNANRVVCGNNFSMAVTEENGKESVWMWKRENFSSSDFIFCEEIPQSKPTLIKSINDLLRHEKSKIKDIQIVDESIGMLLENGKLFTWGNNHKGNLGLYRDILISKDIFVERPTQTPFPGKIKDFGMSDNILVACNEKGEAYYSGLDKYFSVQQLKTKGKIVKVGAYFNNYILVNDQNEVFQREHLPNEENIIFWGKLGYHQIDPKYFFSKTIKSVSGKYQNVLMITH